MQRSNSEYEQFIKTRRFSDQNVNALLCNNVINYDIFINF